MIIETDRLDATYIEKLADQEVLAIRVKQFIPRGC